MIRRIVAVVSIALSFFLLFKQEKSGLEWQTWTPEAVAQAREQGAVVYVDYTARWCATCQVNKRVVFGTDAVPDYVRENDVMLFKADWTDRNDAVTRALAEFGRSAIPFNVIYGPGSEDPIILPELLTPDIVLSALEQASILR